MAIRSYRVNVSTDGAGDGSGRVGIPHGRLVGIQINFSGSAAVGSDTTLASVLDGVTKTLLTLTDVNTDVPLAALTEALKDNVGADVVNTENPNLGLPMVGGNLTVTVAQGGATITDHVKVIFLISF